MKSAAELSPLFNEFQLSKKVTFSIRVWVFRIMKDDNLEAGSFPKGNIKPVSKVILPKSFFVILYFAIINFKEAALFSFSIFKMYKPLGKSFTAMLSLEW